MKATVIQGLVGSSHRFRRGPWAGTRAPLARWPRRHRHRLCSTVNRPGRPRGSRSPRSRSPHTDSSPRTRHFRRPAETGLSHRKPAPARSTSLNVFGRPVWIHSPRRSGLVTFSPPRRLPLIEVRPGTVCSGSLAASGLRPCRPIACARPRKDNTGGETSPVKVSGRSPPLLRGMDALVAGGQEGG